MAHGLPTNLNYLKADPNKKKLWLGVIVFWWFEVCKMTLS
jgi:hypothetical protein